MKSYKDNEDVMRATEKDAGDDIPFASSSKRHEKTMEMRIWRYCATYASDRHWDIQEWNTNTNRWKLSAEAVERSQRFIRIEGNGYIPGFAFGEQNNCLIGTLRQNLNLDGNVQ